MHCLFVIIDEFNSVVYKPLLLDTLGVEGPDCYGCKYGFNRDVVMQSVLKIWKNGLSGNRRRR